MLDQKSIFNISNNTDFEVLTLEVFKHQFKKNSVYRSFCDLLYIHPSSISSIEEIPYLPIQFFKTHKVLSSKNDIQTTFKSSGTTGSIVSKHYITDIELYTSSFRSCFQHVYGNVQDYVILALLPSYLERTNSSLVYMVNDFINQSNHQESGFYLNNYEQLAQTLRSLDASGKKVLLLGVSFALLALIESHKFDLNHTIVMETGGMKGRRKELIREELHEQLKSGFGVDVIHSEYGMTELLSQSYSKGDGVFRTPPWMKLVIRDPADAQTILHNGKTGGINVIDLANINSCSFVATQDLGKINSDGTFEILGRFDHADIRGCNLMVF